MLEVDVLPVRRQDLGRAQSAAAGRDAAMAIGDSVTPSVEACNQAGQIRQRG